MNKELKFYGGQGYGYSTEIGNYEVKLESGKVKSFNRLSDARAYFDSLQEGKAIWDVKGMPELLDAYFFE